MQPEPGSLSQLEPEAWQPWTKTFCISQECGDLTVAFLSWLGFMLSRREGELGPELCACAFRTAWSRTSVLHTPPSPLTTAVAWNYGYGSVLSGKSADSAELEVPTDQEARRLERQDQGRAGDEDLVSALLSPAGCGVHSII